jgi:acetyltransferase-like isoleucine patch superfamily enzyme
VTLIAESCAEDRKRPSFQLVGQSHPIEEAPVAIEDEVRIGASVTALLGVRVGHGGIVGGGSVVGSDVEISATSPGVPARPIRSLTEGDQVQLATKEDDRAV